MKKLKKSEKSPAKKTKNVSVRIPIDLYEKYQEAKEKAKEFNLNVSLSAIIRNSVQEYIEKIKNFKNRGKK
ncbi:MAG: hypothetical protein EVJ48_01500 [Candidatus Acidulodesulfobacterium acidiphilum]|uniref:Ribbon-helix-helix protein, CopG family n=1 Tax=Candidatus Acidulodesulfobacterium acidiphilum TaxID=2597224 RepID=A0A520XG85_9DELT|nr:MAG: hypothetical protein EVJ48_01500 [Candidatus Acidulodesulfobacterium acidiphilum]